MAASELVLEARDIDIEIHDLTDGMDRGFGVSMKGLVILQGVDDGVVELYIHERILKLISIYKRLKRL
jgi:hypothetical protein